MKLLVSACLLGVACRYDGRSRLHPLAQELCRLEHRVYINEQKLRDGKHDGNPAKTEEISETGQK